MTSSGRRVKRRNLDECDGNLVRSHRNQKSRNGRKASRKRSSTSKSLRPQRAAARNALTLFSKITGTSTYVEDEDCLDGDTSESESLLHDSNIESDGSDKYLQNEQRKHLKGKEISLDESHDIVKPQEVHEFPLNGGNRRRLVLKLPLRDSNKYMAQDTCKGDNHADLAGSSSKVPQGTVEGNGKSIISLCSPEDAPCSIVQKTSGVQLDKVGNHLSLSEGCSNGKIRWGGVRARTSKRLRVGDATPSDAFARTSLSLDSHNEKEKNASGCLIPDRDCDTKSSDLGNRNCEVKMDEVMIKDGKNMGDGTSEGHGAAANDIEHPASGEYREYDKPSESIHVTSWKSAASSAHDENRVDLPPELNENIPSLSPKLRLKTISRDPGSPCRVEMKSLVEKLEDGRCNSLHESPLGVEDYPSVLDDNATNRINAEHGDGGTLGSDNLDEKNVMTSVQDLVESHSHSNRMYSAVYRRTKTHRSTTNLDGDGDVKGEGTSSVSNHNLGIGEDSHGESIDVARRTRSMGLKASTGSPDIEIDDHKSGQGHKSGYLFRITQNSSMNRRQLPQEEWESSSRVTVRLRSTRNRRGNHTVRDTSPIDRRKSNKSSKKGSWLMLSTHEEGSRYIPQLGDEVVYLRQVSCLRRFPLLTFY